MASRTVTFTRAQLIALLAAILAAFAVLGIGVADLNPSPAPAPTPSPSPASSSASPSVSPSVSVSPTVSSAVPPFGSFPNATTTGVPQGTVLTAYSGSTTLSGCVTISRATISTDVVVTANSTTPACVTISDSLIKGTVEVDGTGQLLLVDDEIAAPNNTGQSTVVGSNFTLERVNLHGGAKGGVQCDGGCVVQDSWIHDFYLTGASHYDGIGSNGTAGKPLTVNHNAIACTFYATAAGATGGCSANIGLFGDFSPISNVTISNNLFLASPEASYALYANVSAPGKAYPTGTNVVVSGNVFQRGTTGNCAFYGPLTGWGTGAGDVWSGNVFDDGTVITP